MEISKEVLKELDSVDLCLSHKSISGYMIEEKN